MLSMRGLAEGTPYHQKESEEAVELQKRELGKEENSGKSGRNEIGDGMTGRNAAVRAQEMR